MSAASNLFLVAATVLALVLGYITFYRPRRRLYELAALIPGAPEVPLFGNAFQFYGNTVDITNNLKKIIALSMRRGGVAKTWLGPFFYTTMTRPDDVEIVLNSELQKDSVYRFMKPSLGDGLVSGELSIWKRHRKMLMPTFNQKILDGFFDIFVEQSAILVQKMSKEIGKKKFDAFDYLSPCTLDIICETAMGVQVNAQENMDTPYIQAGISESTIVHKRMFQVWLQPEWIFQLTPLAKKQRENCKIVHEFTNNVIKMKKQQFFEKQQREKTNGLEKNSDNLDEYPISKRKAFLDLIIELSEGGGHWTDKEMQEEVDTMTIAGNDTTANAICCVLLMLGSHQHIQDKVVEELYDIYGDSGRVAVREDLPRLQYLERVIKESLRLFPVAPIVVRKLVNEVKLEKYTLPAGSGCVLAFYGIHRDPKIWGDKAEEFDPDNFLPERCVNRHPYAFIPFSAGPRNCIGRQYAMMSMKMVLSTVLRSIKVRTEMDYKTMDVSSEILIKPAEGYQITVERRDTNMQSG